MSNDEIKVGLALSGGGFRATLFHLGSLWRLNEVGWLRKLDIITGVSGGSIISGLLARNWNELVWNDESADAVALNFEEKIARPTRSLCSKSIDVSSVLTGTISPFSTIVENLADAYNEHLFHGAKLAHLPAREPGKTPRFVFYATNLQTGSSVRICRKYMADYKIGRINNPDIELARVVGASSAIAPFLSPVILEFDDTSVWEPMEGAFLHDREDLKSRVCLTDGGVYDNLGLESVWKRCSTMLASDAGAPFHYPDEAPTGAVEQLLRISDIMMEQTRALRKRRLIENFVDNKKKGSYWGITTQINDYELADALVRDNAVTESLQNIRTRLNSFSDEEQGRLVNWGYALTDAAMRKWVIPGQPTPPGRQPDTRWEL